MTVPKILKFGTIFENENGKIELSGFSFLGNGGDFLGSCVDAVIARLKEEPRQFADFKYKAQEQYITAEEARKLGAGKAEWKCNRDNAPWNICTIENCEYAKGYLYRAIKQPEPVEPTCQVRNLETGELKTMTREAAKKLQAELGDTVEWTHPNGHDTCFYFDHNGIYTYKLKGTVKLTIDDEPAKMLTPAQCEAERLARVDTHDVEYQTKSFEGFDITTNPHWTPYDYQEHEYRLTLKQPKLIPLDWKDVPLGVMTNNGYYRGYYRGFTEEINVLIEVKRNSGVNYMQPMTTMDLTLAPTPEQPWLVYIQGETDLNSLKGVEIELKCVLISGSSTLVEIEKMYSSEFMKKLPFIKAYRITGLADGYGYPEQNGGLK